MNKEIKEILVNNIKNEIKKTKEKDFALCIEQWEQLLDYITILEEDNKMYAQLKDEYEDIIDKAIEYIGLNKEDLKQYDIYDVNGIELLKILKGDDNEKYKYVRLDYIEEYNGWEIIKIIPAVSEDMYDMAVLSFEDTPKEDKKIPKKLDICSNAPMSYLGKKINEIIDYLKSKGE